MIELENICAGYGNTQVLHQVSLGCAAGTVTALLGPNGCGKSTLLKAAARLLPTQTGRIFLNKQDAAPLSRKAFAQQVAFLTQSRNVPSLSAFSLVMHGRFPYLGYPRHYSPTDKAAAQKAMERTGAWGLRHTPVGELSGGQRQKVYLAMALAQDTPVLLLDEPTTYLDIAHQLELMELVSALAAEGRTVLMVLHDLNLALRTADTVALLENGHLVASGTPQQVLESGALARVFQVDAEQILCARGTQQFLFHAVPCPEGCSNSAVDK